MTKSAAAVFAAFLLALSVGQAADVTTGYVQGPGGFYKQSDRSGPYVIDGSGNATLLGGVTGADPCFASSKNTAAISNSSTQFRIITGVSGKKTYICGFSYRVSATTAVSVIEGTGSACATASAAMDGSTTAASGKAEAANGGEASGNGSGDLMHTATTANDVCILQSGSALIAGRVSYVQQ